MTSNGPEPGWYFDPDGGDHERFWNGEAWTEHRRLRPSTFNPPPQLNSEAQLHPLNDVRQLQDEAEAQGGATDLEEPDGTDPIACSSDQPDTAQQRRQFTTARRLIPHEKMGVLKKIGQGGQGVVYRAPNVKTKFSASMVYKEYKTQARTDIDFTALAAMPALVEDSLSYAQAERLISIAAWPCAIVEDAGTPTGFVMPAIPDEFFIPLTTVKGVSTITAEFQHLLNHPSVLSARGIEIDDVQRYTLLRELASGLAFLHKHGVCVGDISPKNLLFCLTPHEAVYFIDCDAMRINTVSALPQVETPGWNAPPGEELATIYTDSYKLGLLALRLMVGDHDTTNPQHLPATRPALLRQIITDTLTNQPQQRPLPEAWTYILGNAIELVRHQRVTAAPRSAAPASPPTPIVRSRPPARSVPALRPSAPAPPAPQPLTQPLTRNAAAAVSFEHGHRFSHKKGAWAKVVAPGDECDGQIGKIIEILDDDEDDFAVIVEFPGNPNSYAFRHDELITVTPPADGDFWLDVGIDPITIITATQDFLTLRCYLDDEPIFLGNTGMINVFRSGPTLRRYLASNRPNDMSSLSTYPDVTNAAIGGSLPLAVTDENVYALKGLPGDIAAGPRRVDRLQLELAIELLSDVAMYVKDPIVEDYLRRGQPLGDLAEAVLARNYIRTPKQSFGEASSQWTELENFLMSRLRVK